MQIFDVVIIVVFVLVLIVQNIFNCVDVFKFDKSFVEFVVNSSKILSKWSKQWKQSENFRVLSIRIKPDYE